MKHMGKFALCAVLAGDACDTVRSGHAERQVAGGDGRTAGCSLHRRHGHVRFATGAFPDDRRPNDLALCPLQDLQVRS